MKNKQKKNVSKSFKNGFNWERKATRKHFDDEGELGLRKADKMSATCNKYATDKTLKKTKNGRRLSYSLRQYYKGISVGSLYEYNAIMDYGDKGKNKKSFNSKV